MQQIIIVITASCFPGVANAGTGPVTEYTDQAAWEAVAGPYSTITFTELPANTWISDQYAHLGLHFTDGSDQIHFSPSLYGDDYGLNGAFDESMLEFDVPMTAIAVDFPGAIGFDLFFEGQLIYTSPTFFDTFSPFAGLVSTQPFDKAILYDVFSGLVVDNLYFGPPCRTAMRSDDPGVVTTGNYASMYFFAFLLGWSVIACWMSTFSMTAVKSINE